MNKNLLQVICTICLVLSSFFIKSQNYSITVYDTVKYGAPGELFIDTLTLSNNTSAPVKMFLRRIVKNIPSGWTSCFCGPECLPQTQDTLTFYIPIAGNHSPPEINVCPNFGTDAIPGVGEVIIVLNEVGVEHYDTVRFRGITILSGIEELNPSNFTAYPNPVQKELYISNIGNRIKSIKLFNSLGIKVINHNEFFFNEEIKLFMNDLDNGNYYLEIETIDDSLYRKKITKI